MPCPFCTTSTVIANGTTSSSMAGQENAGARICGAASTAVVSRPGAKAPVCQMASAPTASAAIRGGMREATAGEMLTSRYTAVIGAAIQKPSRKRAPSRDRMSRNTPATMPITIGIGIACMARRTQPVRPSAVMSNPVARNAPITSGKLRWVSAGPTSTVPGMVQKKASGWR